MRLLIIFVVIICAIIYFTCRDENVDAVSSATVYTINMPSKSDDYQLAVFDGLRNYVVRYSPNFIRGGSIQSVEGLTKLKEYGVDTIVSISPNDLERSLAKKFGLKLIELEFLSDTLSVEKLAEFSTILEQPNNYYVHCHGGSHRAGILGMLYRIQHDKWSFDRAKKEFVDLGGYPLKDQKMLDALKKYLDEKDED